MFHLKLQCNWPAGNPAHAAACMPHGGFLSSSSIRWIDASFIDLIATTYLPQPASRSSRSLNLWSSLSSSFSLPYIDIYSNHSEIWSTHCFHSLWLKLAGLRVHSSSRDHTNSYDEEILLACFSGRLLFLYSMPAVPCIMSIYLVLTCINYA